MSQMFTTISDADEVEHGRLFLSQHPNELLKLTRQTKKFEREEQNVVFPQRKDFCLHLDTNLATKDTIIRW